MPPIILQRIPIIGGSSLDLHRLFIEVKSRGGFEKIVSDRRWREVMAVFKFGPTITNASFVLRKAYLSLLYRFEQVYFFRKTSPNILAAEMKRDSVRGVYFNELNQFLDGSSVADKQILGGGIHCFKVSDEEEKLPIEDLVRLGLEKVQGGITEAGVQLLVKSMGDMKKMMESDMSDAIQEWNSQFEKGLWETFRDGIGKVVGTVRDGCVIYEAVVDNNPLMDVAGAMWAKYYVLINKTWKRAVGVEMTMSRTDSSGSGDGGPSPDDGCEYEHRPSDDDEDETGHGYEYPDAYYCGNEEGTSSYD